MCGNTKKIKQLLHLSRRGKLTRYGPMPLVERVGYSQSDEDDLGYVIATPAFDTSVLPVHLLYIITHIPFKPATVDSCLEYL